MTNEELKKEIRKAIEEKKSKCSSEPLDSPDRLTMLAVASGLEEILALPILQVNEEK